MAVKMERVNGNTAGVIPQFGLGVAYTHQIFRLSTLGGQKMPLADQNAPLKYKDGPGSLGLGVVAGVRRNGPVWPHAQRTAERRQHTCSALLPRQRIGSEVVAICLCSDKIKYKYGRGIYIDMRCGCHLL